MGVLVSEQDAGRIEGTERGFEGVNRLIERAVSPTGRESFSNPLRVGDATAQEGRVEVEANLKLRQEQRQKVAAKVNTSSKG